MYNRTNNREKLFISDENRHFFLRKYDEILSLFAETFCWCLLPNHFHLLIRIKSLEAIQTNLLKKSELSLIQTERKFLKNECLLSDLIEQAFKRFFQSYSLSFNKEHKRSGNLFYRPFKRILINKESQFTRAIIYIHANPQKHGLVKNFTFYKWSSWNSILSTNPTKLLREELIDWFGNKEIFIQAHLEQTAFYEDVAIEDQIKKPL